MNEMPSKMSPMVDTVKPRVKLFGLVRDANGKPRIDGDPRKLHEDIRQALTAEEFVQACKDYDEAEKWSE